MKLDLVEFLTESFLNSDFSPYIFLGAPGIGKTAMVEQFGKSLKKHLVTENKIKEDETIDIKFVPLAQIDKVEVAGAPMIVENVLRQKVLDYIPNGRVVPTSKYSVLIFDELNTCSYELQSIVLSLFNERRIGGISLPDTTMFIGLGNRKEDQADTKMLLAPLVSRCTIIEVEPNPNLWLNYAVETKHHQSVIDFINLNPNFLNEPVPGKNTPFACPRTWSILSNRLNAKKSCFNDGKLTQIGSEIIYGTVGKAKGQHFIQFITDDLLLPAVEDILEQKSKLPNEIDKAFAMSNKFVKYSFYENNLPKLNNKKIIAVAKYLTNYISSEKTDNNKSIGIQIALSWMKNCPDGGLNNSKLFSISEIIDLSSLSEIHDAIQNVA